MASQTLQSKPRKPAKVEARLEKELERLKAKLGLGGALSVAWLPGDGLEERGRVVGDRIEVYSKGLEKALETLRHEFVEYVLTHEYLEPRLFEAKLHRQSDRLIDVFARLLAAK